MKSGHLRIEVVMLGFNITVVSYEGLFKTLCVSLDLIFIVLPIKGFLLDKTEMQSDLVNVIMSSMSMCAHVCACMS